MPISTLLTPNQSEFRPAAYSLAKDMAGGGPTTVRAGTATTRQNGLVVDVGANLPRYWEGGLLVEPPATSFVRASETFSGSGWNTTTFASVAADAGTVDPRGAAGALKFTESVGAGNHQAFIIMGASHTQHSVFAKAGTRSWIFISGTAGTQVFYDLANGVVGSMNGGSVGSMEPWGNGWYRCLYYQAGGDSSVFIAGLAPSDLGAVTSYVGDGASYAYMFGAMASDGNQIWTSYVKTVGADATRALDVCSTPTTGWPTSKGEISFDFIPHWTVLSGVPNPGLTYRFLFDAFSGVAGINLNFITTGGDMQCNVGAGSAFPPTGTWNMGQTYRVRVVWNGALVTIYKDGVVLATSNSANNNFSAWQASCYLGCNDGASFGLNGTLANFKVYKPPI